MTHDILFMTAVKRSGKLEIPIVSSTRHDNPVDVSREGKDGGRGKGEGVGKRREEARTV